MVSDNCALIVFVPVPFSPLSLHSGLSKSTLAHPSCRSVLTCDVSPILEIFFPQLSHSSSIESGALLAPLLVEEDDSS